MTGTASHQARAAGLMRVALAILDEAGAATPAALLQQALDALTDGESVVPDSALLQQAAIAADPTMVRAVGGALAVICTLLGREKISSVEEISSILGVYAAKTAEQASAEGLILGYWAAMLRDVGEALGQEDTH